jgi:hypothetical protein|tara:strand:- start:943 stop:1104 length:162 start_codon:yes stop_codon:yes gene_type:complete
MTKGEFTGNGGETWEWEESPEATESIKRLHDDMRRLKEIQDLESKAPDYGIGK